MKKIIPSIPNSITNLEKMSMLESLKKSQENDRFLQRTGKILSSIHQILEIFYKLKDGDSMVIKSDGSIFTGKVKTEKLTERPEILSRKNKNFLDTESGLKMRTSSSVSSPGRAFKNAWDLSMINKPKTPSLLAGIFFYCIEHDPDVKYGEFLNATHGKYAIVELPKQKMKGYVSLTTGILRYIVVGGVEYWL